MPQLTSRATFWRILAGAIALRISLVLLGALDLLQWRVEVSTPANSLRSVREGLTLAQMHISPYSGSLCRTPPLVLLAHQGTALHEHLYALPNILMDVVTGLLLRDMAAKVLRTGSTSSDGIMALFLLNPLVLASCVAGSTSVMEYCAVVLCMWTAVQRTWLCTAAALAVAAYLDLHWALLVVPATLLLLYGPDPISPSRKSLQQLQQQQQQPRSEQPSTQRRGRSGSSSLKVAASVLCLTSMSMAAWVGLAWWSNHAMQHLPGAACSATAMLGRTTMSHLLPRSWQTPQGKQAEGHEGSFMDVQAAAAAAGATEVVGCRCWAQAVYLLHLLVEDQTPNMGQTWYFFTEMFEQYLGLFRFVVHSLSAVLLVPMAIRFPRRPVLLFTAQCLITCMFKPYPSVADHALYLALIPLLQPQLSAMRTGMLLTVSCLLLAVLEPSMWHMWINVESANSNFYYSISLLLGAWQTLLLVTLLLLTVQQEHACKELAVKENSLQKHKAE